MATIESDERVTKRRRIALRHHPVLTSLTPAGAGGAAALGLTAFLGGLQPEIQAAMASDSAVAWVWLLGASPFQALVLGLALGSISALIERKALSRSAPWIIARMRNESVNKLLPRPSTLGWTWGPSVASMIAAIGLGVYLHCSPVVAAFASIAPLLLTYSTEMHLYKQACSVEDGPSEDVNA